MGGSSVFNTSGDNLILFSLPSLSCLYRCWKDGDRAKYFIYKTYWDRGYWLFYVGYFLESYKDRNDSAVGVLLNAVGFGLTFQEQISNSKMITRVTWAIPRAQFREIKHLWIHWAKHLSGESGIRLILLSNSWMTLASRKKCEEKETKKLISCLTSSCISLPA